MRLFIRDRSFMFFLNYSVVSLLGGRRCAAEAVAEPPAQERPASRGGVDEDRGRWLDEIRAPAGCVALLRPPLRALG